MRILLTNDDGIQSPGLRILFEELVVSGHEVMVAAPSRNFSGAGSSLGAVGDGEQIRFAKVGDFDEAVAALSVDAPPSAIVLAMCQTFFDAWRPDIVLSGINNGYNTGRAALHSGTLSAALTAHSLGFSAVAVSTAADATHGLKIGSAVIRELLSKQLTRTRVLNINVPDIASPGGIEFAATGGRSLTDLEYDLEGSVWRIRKVSTVEGLIPGSEAAVIAKGSISISRAIGSEIDGDLEDIYAVAQSATV